MGKGGREYYVCCLSSLEEGKINVLYEVTSTGVVQGAQTNRSFVVRLGKKMNKPSYSREAGLAAFSGQC